MRRVATKPLVVVLIGLTAAMPSALAQSAQPNATPSQPAAAQPALPNAARTSPPKPGSPVVEEIVQDKQPPLDVRKGVKKRVLLTQHHGARRHPSTRRVDRPALAGVELIAPLPVPPEPPHYTVPVPAFPLESVAAYLLTPPPPIVCHTTRRDRSAPDPRLYKEVPVECEADNP